MDLRSARRDFDANTTLLRALDVLVAVAHPGGRSLSSLLSDLGLPKSTLLRIIGTLITANFVVRAGRGHYRASIKLWELGCAAVDYDAVRSEVRDVLKELVDATGETALYTVYDHGRSVYVDKVEGLHAVRAYASVGDASPAYASATGKALLAWQSNEEIVRVAATAVAATPNTMTLAEDIQREAETTKRRGYAVNRGEWRDGVWGVAVPILDGAHEAFAAIGVSGPRDRIEPRIPEMAEIVRSFASKLSVFSPALRARS